jgi:hypothetical protein
VLAESIIIIDYDRARRASAVRGDKGERQYFSSFHFVLISRL